MAQIVTPTPIMSVSYTRVPVRAPDSMFSVQFDYVPEKMGKKCVKYSDEIQMEFRLGLDVTIVPIWGVK